MIKKINYYLKIQTNSGNSDMEINLASPPVIFSNDYSK